MQLVTVEQGLELAVPGPGPAQGYDIQVRPDGPRFIVARVGLSDFPRALVAHVLAPGALRKSPSGVRVEVSVGDNLMFEFVPGDGEDHYTLKFVMATTIS